MFVMMIAFPVNLHMPHAKIKKKDAANLEIYF